jgi:hypothetical protein
MRLEFRYWPSNTEIQLLEDMGDSDDTVSLIDSFYTSATHFYENTAHGMYDGMRAAEAFANLEEHLPPPNVAGAWAEHHDAMRRYRQKHPAVKL